MSSQKTTEVRSDRKSAALGTLAGWAMKFLTSSLRLEVRDFSGRFFTVPAGWNQICSQHRKAVTLTSASHDGDMVARAMAVFGLGAVRGSSSRRGVAALIGLKHALKDGYDVCLTPDGPRGPRYVLQPGVIKLAESSGAPVVPVHVTFSSAFRLKTWDRFVIPMPFSRVEITFAEAIHLPRGMDAATFESERLRIETLLIQGTDDA
jgi:lysophospholipid acyltransferase (LPLAT)-like uncharacterized protein